MSASYGYYVFSATHVGADGVAYGHLFLANGWPQAEEIATRMGLIDVGKLKGLYPASDRVLDWAQQKGETQ